MNVVSLYVNTCRLVLQAHTNDSSSWRELNTLIPQLRDALSCCICSRLVSDPMSPDERVIDVSKLAKSHHVTCRRCLSVTDHLNYVENKCVRIVLLCFRKLCEYIMTGSLYHRLNNDSNSSNCVTEILLESVGLKGNFESIQPNGKSGKNGKNSNNGKRRNEEMTCEELIDVVTNGSNEEMLYNVMFSTNRPRNSKIAIKRNGGGSTTRSEVGDKKHKRGNGSKSIGKTLTRSRYNRTKIVLKKGCRCGNATLTPGKLTCCGQRCPCYVNGKSCFECKCKGCRNPHKKQNVGFNGSDSNNKSSSSTLSSSDDKTTDTGSDVEVF